MGSIAGVLFGWFGMVRDRAQCRSIVMSRRRGRIRLLVCLYEDDDGTVARMKHLGVHCRGRHSTLWWYTFPLVGRRRRRALVLLHHRVSCLKHILIQRSLDRIFDLRFELVTEEKKIYTRRR